MKNWTFGQQAAACLLLILFGMFAAIEFQQPEIGKMVFTIIGLLFIFNPVAPSNFEKNFGDKARWIMQGAGVLFLVQAWMG